MCYEFTQGKKELKKQCDLSDFSVLFEINKFDSEQRAVTEGTSLCLWPVLFPLVTRPFWRGKWIPEH